MATFDKADIEKLVDGVLPWTAVQEMMKSPKDPDRFDQYVEILQDRVDWDDRILLPLTPLLYIVAKPGVTGEGARVVKCRCGHEFGDYRINWKISSLIYVRDDAESLAEVYKGRELPDASWVQVREYVCPGCGAMLEVEAVPRGCPPDFDFLPDLDTFYDEWLDRPLEDKYEFRDLTPERIKDWSLPDYHKPLPELEGFAEDFYEFCKDGELRFQRCDDCGVWRHVPREMCAECGSFKWSWARSSGRGTVFSWTTVERALHPGFATDTPYAAVVVEMEEGVRLVSEVVDVRPVDLEIGMPVEVTFEEVTHDVTLPMFKARLSEQAPSPARVGGNGAGVRVERDRPVQVPATIRYERDGRVAIVTIERPEAHNALTKDMLLGIDSAMADFAENDDLWVAILTGAGDRAFCTGMDLKEAIPLLTSGDALGYEDQTKRQFSDVFKPIVAAVNGMCIAGGMEMLAGTDLRVASETATFGLGEVRWGLVPAGGSHIRVPRQIPWAIAMELLLTGEPISAERAYEIGLVNRVVPAGDLMSTARELADIICGNGPLAVRTSKEIAVRALGLEAGFVLEKALAQRVFDSDDAKEGPQAFKEKRKPDFKGK